MTQKKKVSVRSGKISRGVSQKDMDSVQVGTLDFFEAW